MKNWQIKDLTIELMVDDMDKSLDFYLNLLRFELVTSIPENDPFFAIIKNGKVQIMLYSRSQFSKEIKKFKDMKVGGTVALYIGVHSIEELYRSMPHDIKILQELHKTDYGTLEFSIEDPNGYVLMFNEGEEK